MATPLFSGFRERQAGVLLHPTSLPSSPGAGAIGAAARDFVDFAAECGFSWWQVCPLGPTGYGESPYQCFSAFAGNPLLIDFAEVANSGLFDAADFEFVLPPAGTRENFADFEGLRACLFPALDRVWQVVRRDRARLDAIGDFQGFRKKHRAWLDDYALFCALKKHFGGAPWTAWPAVAREHAAAVKAAWPDSVLEQVEAVIFQQFLFFTQWDALRAHARRRGVGILGDTPIFVAHDSADLWAGTSFFQLNADGAPAFVAGVPPDYFASAGQLWGNPLYDWAALKRDGYGWWMRRLRADLELCDAVRVDHFRGFHDYWQVPANAKDASKGRWKRGPGLDFFKTVRRVLGDVPLIAEDLGELSAGVHTLRATTGLPGMAVLQFAFDGNGKNPHLPHNHTRDRAVYTGTHDNNTTRGWYEAASEAERDRFRHYLGSDGSAPHWDLMRAAFTSPAALAVVPFQDIIGAGAEARFNTPGTVGGDNWRWRLTPAELAHAKAFLAPNLRQLIAVSGRI
ncbi:MAG: 4-alpha-glucanotransferase [Puniceicoccales bacterium]|jgi:4-alpha-glucanotransferase|nr:4-alpha-glucanotransferase [Puniceicoccales bacterium]